MRNTLVFEDRITLEDVEPELSHYLTRRFASEGFAKKIIREIHSRIDNTDILFWVDDVRVYLCSLAMSIGKQLLTEQYRMSQ